MYNCFWCLKHGITNKGCKEKLSWQLCSCMWCTVLYITRWDDAGDYVCGDKKQARFNHLPVPCSVHEVNAWTGGKVSVGAMTFIHPLSLSYPVDGCMGAGAKTGYEAGYTLNCKLNLNTRITAICSVPYPNLQHPSQATNWTNFSAMWISLRSLM